MTVPSQRQPSTLQRLVAMFRGAMRELGKQPSEADLERWAVLIHASMSGRGRSYHTVEHVFTVNGSVDALGSLAILFHDTVYCEVDGGLPRGLEVHLGDALHVDRGRVELVAFEPASDPLRALVTRLFGFTPGQGVNFQSGLNELASALLAVRALRSHLDAAELAQVVLCIEATIPFRAPDAEERLAARLRQADDEHTLGLGPDGVRVAVQRAVTVANRDVGNFAFEDTGAFLSHTWELLPETNPTLRMPAYTLIEYRVAMTKMESFLRTCDLGRVFRSYLDVPNAAELEELRARARVNLARGTRYLRQKLLSARLLETLGQLSGGDAPVSLFMGDLPVEVTTLRLELLLPAPLAGAERDHDPEVLRLLREGRKKDSDFDLRHSPLAAYMYEELGDAATDVALSHPDGWPLLHSLPRGMVVLVARACAQIASTRSLALEAIARQIEDAT